MLNSRRLQSTDENTVNKFVTDRTPRWSAELICLRIRVSYLYRDNKFTLNRTFRLFCVCSRSGVTEQTVEVKTIVHSNSN